jgi:hypothetical protein
MLNTLTMDLPHVGVLLGCVELTPIYSSFLMLFCNRRIWAAVLS